MTRKVSSDDRIVLWQGGSLWVFDILPPQGPRSNRMHAHHAFQLTLAAGGTANIRTGDGLLEGPVVLIAPDHPHAIEPEGRVALLFVEPESRAGAGLRRLLGDRAAARLPPRPDIVAELEPMWQGPPPNEHEVQEIGARILGRLLGPQQGEAELDPRIQRVVDWLGQADGGVTVAAAASVACLSEGRFSHLFVEQTGLPFRTYVLWRRLMRAVQRRAAGDTLTEAAHQAGFSDSAHFSRTFLRMFGIPADTMWLRSRRQ
ncbi:transcriptional regulator, AraC family [Rubellimicrobium mesophilum DSM 19309]|uniref:Transcriptional regulator, AraC family n=1 Tax=Rubellimicrobium mesophilum DSM 19309 TaxID=442562 RepID=A0A017HIT1_9RHOB|nr:helix-turn-helix transcriptional regulator [Rubellimicrobium mesophilum]EYD74271.1 transcriptional regulator, AraC family [Rubellimicrobium mesophilum DSM 19309]